MPLRMAAYSQRQWEDWGEGWSAVSRDNQEEEQQGTKRKRGYEHKGFQHAGEEEGVENYEFRDCTCRTSISPLPRGKCQKGIPPCISGEGRDWRPYFSSCTSRSTSQGSPRMGFALRALLFMHISCAAPLLGTREHRQVCWTGEVGQREQECGRQISRVAYSYLHLCFQVRKC